MIKWLAPLILILAAQPAAALTLDKQGKTLYRMHCAMCHGGDFRANTPVGQRYDPPPADLASTVRRLGPEKLYTVIAEGTAEDPFDRDAMPAFADKLTPDQIRAVVDYLRGELAE